MISFSAMRGDQLDELVQSEILASDAPWTGKMLRDSLKASANCRVIQESGLVVGYCVVQSVLDEAELLNIVIFKSFQARGFGYQSICALQRDLLESGICSVFLEVRASNAAARALYRKTGFEVIHTRSGYYRRKGQITEDALVMRCQLS